MNGFLNNGCPLRIMSPLCVRNGSLDPVCSRILARATGARRRLVGDAALNRRRLIYPVRGNATAPAGRLEK